MTGDQAYSWLTGASPSDAGDAFDIHAVASILALAVAEMAAGTGTLAEGCGLTAGELMPLARAMFPRVSSDLEAMMRDAAPQIDAEEQSLRDILLMYATGESLIEKPLAAMIARRCRAPHHLWQDLGLRDRTELSHLMQRHFSPLAARNQKDMKWKKFLYRMVCGAEGFTLCAAPVCTECDDFKSCFGQEDGASRLARAGNGRQVLP